MPDYRLAPPKILWGAALANTLNIGYRVDNALSGHELRAGSTTDRAPSGVEDAWVVGDDFLLEFDVRWIPQGNTAVPLATGWDGGTGFVEFLAWARKKNVLRYYPDASGGTFIDCYLVDPMTGSGDLEADGTRKVRLKLRETTQRFEGY